MKKALRAVLLILAAGSLLLSCGSRGRGLILYSASLNGNLAGCDCSVPVAGLTKRAAYMRDLDLSASLILDGGNILEAGPDQVLSRYILDIYRELSYDLMVPGPQEFAGGPGSLAEFRDQYPFGCLNLSLRDSRGSWNAFSPPEAPVFFRKGAEYRVYPLMGAGLFRLYPDSFWEQVRIEDPLEALNRTLADSPRGEVSIVLFHGTEQEARQLVSGAFLPPDLLILAGEEKVLEEVLPSGTLLVSPGEEGNRLGMVNVRLRKGNPPVLENRFEEFSYLQDPDDREVAEKALAYKTYLDHSIRRTTSLIEGPVELYYSPRCRSCEEILPKVKSVDKALLLSIQEPENYEQLMSRAEERETEIREFPVLIWNSRIIQGLEGIRFFLNTGELPEPERVKDGSSPLLALSVLGAGLLDGINPCAFTTILLLISSIGISGASRSRQARSGLVFAASVFVFYLAVGAGFFRFLEAASFFPRLEAWGHRILMAVLILFALLNLYDALQLRKKDNGRVLLQLSGGMKNRIRTAVRRFRKGSLSIGAAVVLGFLVSLFELGCTGQIYLPTIAYMIDRGGAGRGYLLLLLYNLGFILPLLGVLGAALAGAGLENVGRFFSRHLIPVKLIMAGLFLAFALTLL